MAGKYEKICRIGSGTFGEAWLVNSICSKRSYVIKEVRVCDLSKDELERTQREASVLSRCKHINIIRYKESFLIQSPLTMCLVMEYADGGDLYEKEKEALTLNKLIPEASILHWFIQIIFAVQYLHSNNILHRDLKTQNIFLTHNNIVKVGDFGIARFLRNKQDLATTAIGTPYYLSPEICLRKPYNYTSDMWAVGCILYELCSLKHPFEADDIDNLILKILHGIYAPLNYSYSRLIHELTTVLLNTNPLKRPTADDVLLIPALRIVVQDYIKRHEQMISNYSNVRRVSSSGEATSSNERLNEIQHKGMAHHSEKVENWESEKLSSSHDGIHQCTPPGRRRRRDSQTQTPPDWSFVESSGHKHISTGSDRIPHQLRRDKEKPNSFRISSLKDDSERSSLNEKPNSLSYESPDFNKTYTIFPVKLTSK